MRKIHGIASKSDAHRALICAALSKNNCKVVMDTTSEDIEATKRCLEAWKKGEKKMYCQESGSTFRFLLPVMGALGFHAEFYPEGRLPQRPLSPLYEEMIKHGCILSRQGQVPFCVSGKLQAGEFKIPGNVSSQYISGLLFALPLLEQDSTICILGELQSKAYIEMTVRTLKSFGISIEEKENGYFVAGGQEYQRDEDYQVEGDWSNAAFWLVAGAFLAEGVEVKGLEMDSPQGDKKIVEILKKFGAKVTVTDHGVQVSKGELQGIEISVSQIPDMVPALAVLAAGAKGETRITNAERLRLKESDRLKSITQVIRNLGGTITEWEDSLVIHGTGTLTGGEVDSYGDHRIAMMAAIASLICKEQVIVTNGDAVKKSYPDFFEDLHRMNLDSNCVVKKGRK